MAAGELLAAPGQRLQRNARVRVKQAPKTSHQRRGLLNQGWKNIGEAHGSGTMPLAGHHVKAKPCESAFDVEAAGGG